MSESSTASKNDTATHRGRPGGRAKSRGGLGKYLRASGRGRGRGRPAEFTHRLLLEGEGNPDLSQEEAAELKKELTQKYGRRKLGTNLDRYKEEEVELDSDGMLIMLYPLSQVKQLYHSTGEPIVEPEVDLSSFLEKQRISDDLGPTSQLVAEKDVNEDEDDIQKSLDALKGRTLPSSKKGKVQQIVWDEELENLNREKKAAEAARG